MLKDVLKETLRIMLEAEEEMYTELPDFSVNELVDFFSHSQHNMLDSYEHLERLTNGEYKEISKEVVFSTFRVMKAILAELEYRINEDKI